MGKTAAIKFGKCGARRKVSSDMAAGAYTASRIGVPVTDLIARAEIQTAVGMTGDAVLHVPGEGDGEYDARASRVGN